MRILYSVFFITYDEGIRDVNEWIFSTLPEAKTWVEQRYKPKTLLLFIHFDHCCNYILKFVETGACSRKFIKKVWVYNNNSWHSTRHVGKYYDFMKLLE